MDVSETAKRRNDIVRPGKTAKIRLHSLNAQEYSLVDAEGLLGLGEPKVF